MLTSYTTLCKLPSGVDPYNQEGCMRSTSQRSHIFMRLVRGTLLIGTVLALEAGWNGACAASTADVPAPLLQNWSKKLPSAPRFTVLSDFGNAAVRDDETGLVWEKTLETTELSWPDARNACADKDVGGRKGFRCRKRPATRCSDYLPWSLPTNIRPPEHW